MITSDWMHVGTVLKMNARHYPEKLGCQDKNKSFSFSEWNRRSCQLANALLEAGAGHGERVSVMAYNRVEWMEIYAACAKGGQIAVPVMFRLSPPEVEYIVNHAGSKVMIVEEPFVPLVDGIRERLTAIPPENYIYLGAGAAPPGYVHYESFLARGDGEEPPVVVRASDPWTILYTSGTTGKPKGVVRTHESFIAQYLLNNINMGVRSTDKVMMVMPMCHVNSVYYSFPYTYVGAPVMVYNMISFDPEDLLKTIAGYKITFTSLVPTHYIMMLALPDEVKNKYDVSSIRQLLISSAPARRDTKLAIMDFFKNAELWEAYGSTEAGLITLLRPEEQFDKLGSIGREIYGIDRIKLLDEQGREVAPGEVGELYSRSPNAFKEYWRDEAKTRAVCRDGWITAGDMARRDADGYYYLVDRKANMIITGGENVYPSEVENVIGTHPAVKDVAVFGVPDAKWGEAVKAVIVLHEHDQGSDTLAGEIIEFCRGKIAGYKRPKSVEFIREEEMPRTGTGKILHRVLRERYGG
ncbi:class I adenylate-forming enzyme family protein [Desulfotomaculum copahuensis]|uniref:Long-chain fatty acid--CoA ligase n=1 Tax=Desulfotomaculum copahuensis TaxID=1838280 RepID=A0A1B7LGM4_9FIRM|nr:AMP-binding protein [Desulfotomaculum copahuensis]OAT85253.1 long-chain fatty acid--CoA ligase [Desulfotomaculum copahuensis]